MSTWSVSLVGGDDDSVMGGGGMYVSRFGRFWRSRFRFGLVGLGALGCFRISWLRELGRTRIRGEGDVGVGGTVMG